MSTANKLTYLNVTKQKLKQAINNIGGEVTDETTFRNYANQLQNVYDRLPKTEFEEGESVTLENTLKGKLDFQDGKVGFGQTEQESTQGYQLLANTDVNSGDNNYWSSFSTYDVDERTLTRTVNSTTEDYITHRLGGLKKNTTYTLRLYAKSNGYVQSMDLFCYGPGVTGAKSLTNLNLSTSFQEYTWTFTTDDIEYGSGTTIRIDNNGTTQSGTNAILTIKDVMLEEGSTAHNWEPYTGGQASPNPSYPQEIKYVAGKNKFNGEFRQGNQDQTGVSVRIFSAENNWKLKVGKTYTISTNIDTSIYKYALYIAKYPYLSVSPLNTYLYQSGYKTSSSFTFTVQDDGYFGFTVARISETDIVPSDMENIWFQVEENNQATPYLPYNTIEEVVGGKNKFDKNNITFYASNNSDFNGVDASNKIRERTNSIAIASVGIKTNTTYKISGLPSGWELLGIGTFTQEDGSNTSQGSVNNNTFIINNDNVKYIFYLFRNNDSTEVATELFNNANIQIEKGSTATDYEPYKAPKTYQFSLGDNKFYGIGDYKDAIITDRETKNWYKFGAITEVRLTSALGWSKVSSIAEGTGRYICNKADAANLLGTNTRDALSNCFKPLTWDEIYTTDTTELNAISLYNQAFTVDHRIVLRVENSIASSVNELNSYLDNNLVFAYYILQFPVLTPITGVLAEQLEEWWNGQSLDGTTIIEGNGDLPMIIKVRGLKGE